MAYIPANCDNKCQGCEKNISSWCVWKDKPIPRWGSNIDSVNQYYSSINSIDNKKDYGDTTRF